jgi:excisionase family DNA binding protein
MGAAMTCPVPGCGNLGAGTSGYCADHFAAGGRQRARRVEQELLASERDWYTLVEAANVSNRPRPNIEAAIRAEELPSEKVGRHRRIPRRAFDEWNAGASRPRPTTRLMPAQRQARDERILNYYRAGQPPGWIADTLGCSKPTVTSVIDREGLERPGRGRKARRLSPAARRRRQLDSVARYERGESLGDIAKAQGSSKTQVRRDLEACAVEVRPPGKQAIHPPAEARACQHCGTVFTPEWGCLDDRRFCGDPCARAARARNLEVALEQNGLIGVGELAERLGVGERTAWEYIDRGLVPSKLISVEGALRPIRGITDAHAGRFVREWALGGDPRRRFWQNPDAVLARMERTGELTQFAGARGLSLAEARAVVRDRVERRRQLLARRRRGRKPAAGPPRRHIRWLQRFEELGKELRSEHRLREELGLVEGEPVPRDWDVAEAVAEEDWLRHPEAWPREHYPASRHDPQALDRTSSRSAADRVLTAIKRLQNAQTVIRAA